MSTRELTHCFFQLSVQHASHYLFCVVESRHQLQTHEEATHIHPSRFDIPAFKVADVVSGSNLVSICLQLLLCLKIVLGLVDVAKKFKILLVVFLDPPHSM